MRPTVQPPTAWHSSERSENGCDLLYTPVSELGRLWAFKGDCDTSYFGHPTGARLPVVPGLEPASEPCRMRRLAATLPRLTQGRPSTQKRFEHARCKVSSALLERLQRQPTGGAYE
eukprot:scaffold106494_cov49-Phaeocystis_antarctica.AAC.1